MASDHKPSYMAVLLICVVTYSVTMVLNALAATSPNGQALFHNSTAGISKYYYIDLTPAGWTYALFGVTYFWLALFMVYSLSTLCRRSSQGYLYVSPGHQPPALYIFFTLNMLCNFSWLLLQDRFYPQYSLLFVLLLPVTLIICLCISHVSLYRCAPMLEVEGLTKEVWRTRMITQNGLACYCAWVWFSVFFNLDVVLVYIRGFDVSFGGTICLSLLLLSVFVYFILDYQLDKYLRYTFMPYVVFLIAVPGIINKNFERTSSNTVLLLVLLFVVVLVSVLKGVMLVKRHKNRPLYPLEQDVKLLLEDSEKKKDYGTVKHTPVENA